MSTNEEQPQGLRKSHRLDPGRDPIFCIFGQPGIGKSSLETVPAMPAPEEERRRAERLPDTVYEKIVAEEAAAGPPNP